MRTHFLSLVFALLALSAQPVHAQQVSTDAELPVTSAEAAVDPAASPANAEAAAVAPQVLANASWREESARCPADLMPATRDPSTNASNNCQSGKLQQCLNRCTAGAGTDCYWLANAIQQREQPDAAIEPLYQRACKLGVVSGCTNRAASEFPGWTKQQAETCQARTFKAGCRKDDPWACAMYARSLAGGTGVTRHLGLSLDMIYKTCQLDGGEDACRRAMDLRKQILAGPKAK